MSVGIPSLSEPTTFRWGARLPTAMPYCEKCGQRTRKLADCKGCRYLASVQAASTRTENYYTQREPASSSGGDRNPWTPPEEPQDEWTPISSPCEPEPAAASSGSRVAEPARKKQKRSGYLASPLITDKIKTALLEGDIEAVSYTHLRAHET